MERSEIKGRVNKALEGAKSTLANVLPYADKTQLPVLVPVGSNNAGKSYFINNLVLADQQKALSKAKIEEHKKKFWANHFPVRSSSGGGEALTVLATRIRANLGAARVFLVKLVLASEAEFERRQLIYRGDEDSDQLTQKPFGDLKKELDVVIRQHFPKSVAPGVKGSEQTQIVVARAEGENFNIFDELDRFRTQMAEFESAISENSALSWLVQIEIEGPFPNLKSLGIEVMDVKKPFFFSFHPHPPNEFNCSMSLFCLFITSRSRDCPRRTRSGRPSLLISSGMLTSSRCLDTAGPQAPATLS